MNEAEGACFKSHKVLDWLGDQHRYEAPDDLPVKNDKNAKSG